MYRVFGMLAMLLVFAPASGQMFHIHRPLFGEKPFFNEEWIKEKKIRQIRGEVSFKSDGFPIRESAQFYEYHFNQKGQLIRMISSIHIRHRYDTVFHYYDYDEKGRLVKMISSDAYGFYALNYVYRNDLLVRVSHSRENEVRAGSGEFISNHIVWSDSLSHDELPEGSRVSYHSQGGRLYKTENKYFNENGLLHRSENRSVVGDDLTVTNYYWNDKWQLLNMEESTTLSGHHELSKKFTYDEHNRLDKEITGKDGELYTERKLVYDKEGLLELQLIRNDVTKVMEIIQYNYRFY